MSDVESCINCGRSFRYFSWERGSWESVYCCEECRDRSDLYGEWCRHDGGECPVNPDCLLEVYWSGNVNNEGVREIRKAGAMYWGDQTPKWYRVIRD